MISNEKLAAAIQNVLNDSVNKDMSIVSAMKQLGEKFGIDVGLQTQYVVKCQDNDLRQSDISDARMATDVQKIISDLLGIDTCGVHLWSNLADDLGVDELDMVELSMAFEEKYIINIDDEVMQRLLTVQDVIDYIATNRAG
jgi:acyl carrier protein